MNKVNEVENARWKAEAQGVTPGAKGRVGTGWRPDVRKQNNIPSLPSASVRVTPENRAVLRYLRQLEMEGWAETSPVTNDPWVEAGVPLPRASATLKFRGETYVYGFVALVAAAAVLWALADSANLMSRWPEFVALVRQLLGT